MGKKLYLSFYFALFFVFAHAQLSDGLISTYYFTGNANDTISHNNGKVRGATLTTDRFGNSNAAYSFDGENDLINLGTSLTLKPALMSISLWVKINDYKSNNKNYLCQPFIFTKCINAPSFYEAYSVALYIPNKKFSAGNTSSLQKQISTISNFVPKIDEWNHVVYMFDVDSVFLYVNGVLQQKNFKGFFSSYLESDSVVLGYAGNPEPDAKFCWLNGCLDDIKLYNRLLKPEEVNALYHEPNPILGTDYMQNKENKFLVFLKEYWFVFVGFLFIVFIAVVYIRFRIRKLIKRNKEKSDLERKFEQMEMQALRSQMNPHFIFNAINSIQHYVLINEKELANKYLIKFSQLMRSVLELTNKELISLKDELDTIALYVEIETLRFEDNFNFEMKIDNTVNSENIKLPPLIIQPFVENAIWHGLLLKKGNKKLMIYVHQKDNLLIIEVDDNGIGRKAASEFKNKDIKRKSFGMSITQDRLLVLEKLFGIKTTIEVIDKMNEGEANGTRIVICVNPKKESI